MPEVDPATLSRFVAATTKMASARDQARITDQHVAINPNDREAVYRRLRRSASSIGAMFRGLEKEIGSEPALEFTATLVARGVEVAGNGNA